MEKRSFGKTDMHVSVLGLGFGSLQLSGSSTKDIARVIEPALAMGVNVLDTAECYGQSEEMIGQAVSHRRHEYYLFTKCGHAIGSGIDLPDWHPQLLEQSIEQSLRRLKTDYLDLIQLHSCSEEQLRAGEVIAVLQRARDAGKVRYIGYSGDRRAALYAVQCGAFDALQTSVNIADQEAIDLTIPAARAKHMGIIAKRSLAGTAWKAQQRPNDEAQAAYWQRLATLHYDFLQGNPDDALSTALRFTLSVPGVSVALVGTSHPDHVQHNITLLDAGPLRADQVAHIRTRWKAATMLRKWLPGGRWGWHGWV